jgi:hypothetical protein
VSAAVMSLLFLAAMLVSAWGGMRLRQALPDEHTASISSDAVLRAVGFVVTLTALVLGFFVNSSKAYYDAVSNQLNQIGADISVLDRTLARFGPGAAPAREMLRRGTGAAVHILWPDHKSVLPTVYDGLPIDGLERMEDEVRALPADDARHEHLKEQAIDYVAGIEHESLMLGELATTSMHSLLLLIVLSWLVIIYAGFGVVWPRTGTALAALVMSAVAAAGAIFMILELYSPLHGIVHIDPSVLELPLTRTLPGAAPPLP